MPIESGSPTGANMIEAQAAAKVNCMTPEYVPATIEPVLVGTGSAAEASAAEAWAMSSGWRLVFATSVIRGFTIGANWNPYADARQMSGSRARAPIAPTAPTFQQADAACGSILSRGARVKVLRTDRPDVTHYLLRVWSRARGQHTKQSRKYSETCKC